MNPLLVVKALGGWRATAFAVLAVAAIVAVVIFQFRLSATRTRAAAAIERAEALQGELRAAREAAKRDVVSDVATSAARESGERRQAESSERARRVKAIGDEKRPPVPAVCPPPDARLMRELSEGEARLRATEGRLRDLRPSGN